MNGGSCLSVQILVYTVHLLAEADGFKKKIVSVLIKQAKAVYSSSVLE